MNNLSQKLYSLLQTIDTPTVCNAIEMAQGKRGFSQFTKKQVMPAINPAKPLVGFAKTAIIKASEPSLEPTDMIKEKRMAYYKYMSEVTIPTLAVIEDQDVHPVGAFWGEINTWVHQGFGIAGVITNGLMRDLDDLAPNFQVLASSTGPSHAFVHIIDYDQPIEVFGLKIKPNDLLHADKHGVVNIPEDIIPQLYENIEKLIATEKIILNATKKDNYNFEQFKIAWEAFEKARV